MQNAKVPLSGGGGTNAYVNIHGKSADKTPRKMAAFRFKHNFLCGNLRFSLTYPHGGNIM